MGPRCGHSRTGAARVNGLHRDPKRKKIAPLGATFLCRFGWKPVDALATRTAVDRKTSRPHTGGLDEIKGHMIAGFGASDSPDALIRRCARASESCGVDKEWMHRPVSGRLMDRRYRRPGSLSIAPGRRPLGCLAAIPLQFEQGRLL